MKRLDDQEIKIAKALIRNPRISDNRLGEENGIPPRTVGRKRARMEEEGLLRYFTELDMGPEGTGYFQCRHLYIVRFKVGVTIRQLREEIDKEPNVATVFTRAIYESHLAEIDGRVALVMVVDGTSEADIVDKFQEQIVPSLRRAHGDDSIEEVSTIRLLGPVRIARNYLLGINIEGGNIRDDWNDEAIFVG